MIVDQNKLSEKFDLFSFNLQRGRDHGLLSYGDMRKVFKLKPVSFKDMCQKD